MSETADTAALSSRDEIQRVALRLLQDLRDEGVIVFTSELEALGWYNETRRHSFSRADMSKWTDAGWEPVFRYRPRPDGLQEVLERFNKRVPETPAHITKDARDPSSAFGASNALGL